MPTNSGFAVYETCSYCNKGKDSLKEVNTFTAAKGFYRNAQFESSFKGSFYGEKFKIAYLETVGVTKTIGIDEDGNPILDGYAFSMLSWIGKLMKFKIELIHSPDGSVGKVVNNTPTGILGLVGHAKADVGVEFFSANIERYKFVDFSPAYFTSDLVVFSDSPPKGLKLFSFLQPFQLWVWVLLGISILVVSICLYFGRKFTKEETKITSFYDSLWAVAKIVLWDTSLVKTKSNMILIFLSVFMLMTMILISVYMGTLTSFLTADTYLRLPIESLQGCKDANMKWVGKRGVFAVEMLMQDEYWKRKFVPIPSADTNNIAMISGAMKMISDNPNQYCFINSKDSTESIIKLFFIDEKGRHNFHVGKHPIISAHVVFFIRKDALFKNTFDNLVLRMNEMGISLAIMNNVLEFYEIMGKARARKNPKPVKLTKQHTLEIKHLAGCRIMFSLGVVISFTVFLIEVVWCRTQQLYG